MRKALRSLGVSAAFAAAGIGFSVAAGPLQFWPHDGGASVCAPDQNRRVLFGDFFRAPAVGVTITGVGITDAHGAVIEDAWAATDPDTFVGAWYASDPLERPPAVGAHLGPNEEVNIVGLFHRTTDRTATTGPMIVYYSIAGIPFKETLGIDFTIADTCF